MHTAAMQSAIDAFLASLRTPTNPNAIAQTCNRLWKLTAIYNLTIEDTARLAPSLTECLGYGPMHTRCSAAGVLTAMLLQHDARSALASDPHAADIALCLVSLMDTSHPEAMRVACSAIANAALDSYLAITLLELNVINKLTNALAWVPVSEEQHVPWPSVVEVCCIAVLAIQRCVGDEGALNSTQHRFPTSHRCMCSTSCVCTPYPSTSYPSTSTRPLPPMPIAYQVFSAPLGPCSAGMPLPPPGSGQAAAHGP